MTAPRPFFNVMKMKLWLRQHSISAPQMTIRRQLSWPAKATIAALAMGVAAAIAFGGYDLGRNFTAPRQVEAATQNARVEGGIAKSQTGRDQVAGAASATESQINIERSAQRALAEQVKTLETENSKLKEDLAFFESLLPSTKAVGGLSIRRMTADIAGPNQLRYRLLVMQGGKVERDFNGTVQLAVTVLQQGKSAIIIFPEVGTRDPADMEKFQLSFKRYQRIEGLLTLPDGVQMMSLQARILEKGRLRAQETTILEGDS